MGAPADVPVVWSRRLLRQLSEQARHRALPRNEPSPDPLVRATRRVVLVLRRRGRLRARRPARSVPPLSESFVKHTDDATSNPRDIVVVLLDSLNRHMLGSYGGGEFETPNLDRLAS